jgi:methylase of polypeptide subunit release factors
VETDERIGRIITRAVAIKGENRMVQTGKKPERNRISEEDWKKYVDAVRRDSSRRHPLKHLDRQQETES